MLVGRVLCAAPLRLAAGTGQLSRRHCYQEVRTDIVVLYIPLARAAVAGNAGEAPVKPELVLSDARTSPVAGPLGHNHGD